MQETDHVKLVHSMNREIGALHATMKHNHDLHSSNALKIEKIADTTSQILVQATKTNGRVSSLEKTTEQLATIIARQDAFIVEGQNKLQKAISDGEATQRMVNELTNQRKEHDKVVNEKFEEAQTERKKLHWSTIAFWVNLKNKGYAAAIIVIIAWVAMAVVGLSVRDVIEFLIKLI